MMIDICFGTRSAWKMILLFAEAPGKALSAQEIRKHTGLGNKVVYRFLAMLEKFGIVTCDKIGKLYFYKLNLASQYTRLALEIAKAEKKELNNADFEIANILREFTYGLANINLENLSQIILFGSHAKRTAYSESDIDVAVITSEKSVKDEIIATEFADGLRKRFGREIQAHYFTEKEFESMKKSKNKLAAEILRDGIRIM
ncbi:MAG: nucleotidyltransferase domain-containing protein [Nanoarchaeota archaeon]|nr:nucleotidyltransferase domain-containing protein [Nanoarchaeota archaeon]